MKLLITLSILLTSSPLFGQETGVLYLWENGTKYMGEWKDGKRHGQGNMTYHDGSKFVGKWKDGKRHGQGNMTYATDVSSNFTLQKNNVLTFHDGSKFVGKWKNGKRHGQGTWKHPYGRTYVGGYKNGWWHGKGVTTARDGQRWYTFYDGEFKKGHFHGQGKLVVTKIDDDGTLLGRWNLGKWKGLTIIGEFRNGNFWDTKSYNDKGEQQTFSVAQGKWYGE